MPLDTKEDKNMPTQRVLDLQKGGMSEGEITNTLSRERFGQNEISNAFDQATVKNEIAPARMPLSPPALNPDEVPSPSANLAPTNVTNEMPQISNPDLNPSPVGPQGGSPNFAPEPAGRANYEAIEEIAESVIAEKWEDALKNIGDLKLWKEKVETDLSGIKQEILRTESKFENLQKAILGKLGEYSEGVTDLGAEMKAMEKIFEKILAPLTRSVKDLEAVTEKIKK
jgi:hypothetical protein